MRRRRIIKVLLYVLTGFLLLMAGFYVYFKVVTRVTEPEISDESISAMTRTRQGPHVYSCEHGWLRKANEGWWVMYLEGSPYEIGYAHGLLTEELNYSQEKAFLERLGELIPSKFYQQFMLGFVRFFNRDLEDYVLPEYRQEIFGISRFASPEFDFMGPSYARMLNYHAAHDLGHAIQNMNLVACTAFGAWDGHSADSGLILGRNFDFYINEAFAADKILCFIRPDSGYSFAMITWAGFAGVVSGMNEKGLTVTLNAAKSSIPLGAKTPVSLLAREILQYASTISEAYAIAQKRETFVAESFLIGSAADRKAVVIEKSPEKIALFDPGTDHLILTNHFQSDTFRDDRLNIENMKNETSVYRHQRLAELLDENPHITPETAAAILRDDKGLGNRDIGLGNEKAINQYIAHHSVIFQPAKLRIWIAGPPYQLGEFRAYDLDSPGTEGHRENVIESDNTLLNHTFPQLVKYRNLAKQIESGQYQDGDADSLILYNPEFFHTYRILGDYCRAEGIGRRAEDFYRMALEKEAPSKAEREAVERGGGY
jgi:isopenicillin-N N-acyltransferase like protein